MSQQAHAYITNSLALLSDSRRFIDSASSNNRSAIYSITASISALESFLNELIELGNGYAAHGLNNPISRMSIILKLAEEKRLPTPKKFLCAYSGISGINQKKGECKQYQRIVLATEARNQLAHPKASRLTIKANEIKLEDDTKLYKKLVSNGFKADSRTGNDWHSVVKTKAFALWSYQSVLDCMNLIFDAWPYKNAIASFKDIYSTTLYTPEDWQNLANQN